MKWYWILLIVLGYLMIGFMSVGVCEPSKKSSAIRVLFLWPLLLVGIVLQFLVYGIEFILFGKKDEKSKNSSDSAAQ